VNMDCAADIVIDSTICHLESLFDSGGIGHSDIAVRELQHEVVLQIVIAFLFFLGKLHLVFAADELRHLQVVGGLHADRDIRNFAVDGLFRAGQRLVGVDDLAVPLVRHEVVGAILPNEAAESLTHVQKPVFSPQIHEAVAAGRTGQPMMRGRAGGPSSVPGSVLPDSF
jgi:hypothetical protein